MIYLVFAHLPSLVWTLLLSSMQREVSWPLAGSQNTQAHALLKALSHVLPSMKNSLHPRLCRRGAPMVLVYASMSL